MSFTRRRPRSVTIILITVILVGMWYAGQLFALIRQNSLLLSLNMTPDPRLRLVMAAVWMVLFWGAAFALWRNKSFTTWFIPLLLGLIALYELTIWGLFVQISGNGQGWLMRIWLFATLVILAFWSLNRSSVKYYFNQDIMR